MVHQPSEAPNSHDAGNQLTPDQKREAAIRRFFSAYSRQPDVARAILAASANTQGLLTDVERITKREEEEGPNLSYEADLLRSTAALYAGAIMLETTYPPAFDDRELPTEAPATFGEEDMAIEYGYGLPPTAVGDIPFAA